MFGFGIIRWLLKQLTGNGQPLQWKVDLAAHYWLSGFSSWSSSHGFF